MSEPAPRGAAVYAPGEALAFVVMALETIDRLEDDRELQISKRKDVRRGAQHLVLADHEAIGIRHALAAAKDVLRAVAEAETDTEADTEARE